MLDNTKKLNGPLFQNQVKLGPKTSDLVFACLKVFKNTIWTISEPWRQPIFRFLYDLKKNIPRDFVGRVCTFYFNIFFYIFSGLTCGLTPIATLKPLAVSPCDGWVPEGPLARARSTDYLAISYYSGNLYRY